MQNRTWKTLPTNNKYQKNEYTTQNGDITSIKTVRGYADEILEIRFNSEKSKEKFRQSKFYEKFGWGDAIMFAQTANMAAIYDVGLIRITKKENLLSMLENEYPQISEIKKEIVQDLNVKLTPDVFARDQEQIRWMVKNLRWIVAHQEKIIQTTAEFISAQKKPKFLKIAYSSAREAFNIWDKDEILVYNHMQKFLARKSQSSIAKIKEMHALQIAKLCKIQKELSDYEEQITPYLDACGKELGSAAYPELPKRYPPNFLAPKLQDAGNTSNSTHVEKKEERLKDYCAVM